MSWYTDRSRSSAVREYGNRGAMDRDMNRAASHGWEVISTAPKTRRQLWKLSLGGLGWLFWPTTGFVVTYHRPPQPAG